MAQAVPVFIWATGLERDALWWKRTFWCLLLLPDLISIKPGRACLPRQARIHAPARQARPNLPKPRDGGQALAQTAFGLMGNAPENALPERFQIGAGHDPGEKPVAKMPAWFHVNLSRPIRG